MIVNDFLVQNFPTIINEDFTAQMETKLDNIAENKLEWKEVISKFYSHLSKLILELQEKGIAGSLTASLTDKICDKCGAQMLLKNGKNGSFYACSNYPNCKNTKPLFEDKVVAKCPKCGKDFLEKTSKRGTKYYACEDYKNCKLMLWGIPTGEKCPKCGDYLFINNSKNGKYIKCANKDCTYKANLKEKDNSAKEENKSE